MENNLQRYGQILLWSHKIFGHNISTYLFELLQTDADRSQVILKTTNWAQGT